MSISAAKRRSLPKGEFAIPSQNKYPIDTAARTRNAAARLEQNKGSLSSSEYSAAKSRIAAAAKKFGISSEYNKPKRSMSGGRGLNMKISSDGSMHIRHMSDEDRCTAVMPGATIELTDSGAPIWNQLALSGVYKGHPSGAFEMTAKTFAEIERNFKRDGIDIPFDFNHASELPASDSSVAQGQSVASGWIKDIRASGDKLMGLVEWTPDARKKILAKEFKYISPAIRFGAVDGKTGDKVGAKLTSSALTNKPFLKDLPPALASDTASPAFLCSDVSGGDVAMSMADSKGGYMYSSNEYLPRLRSAMGMDSLSSPVDMKSRVSRLMDLCDMADGDPGATVEGIPLSNYIAPLRDYMRMPANTTLDDMLCAVMDMVEACCEDGGEDDDNDSQGAEMADITSVEATQVVTCPAPVAVQKESTTMSENTITMADHEAKISTAVAAATAPLSLQLTDVRASLEAEKIEKAALEAKIVTLSDQIKKQGESVTAARVEDAFETYKEAKKLSESDKKAMALVLASDSALFDTLYPKLSPAKAVLLRTVTASDTGASSASVSGKTVPALKVLIAKAVKENPNATYDEQFSMAYTEHATLMAAAQ